MQKVKALNTIVESNLIIIGLEARNKFSKLGLG